MSPCESPLLKPSKTTGDLIDNFQEYKIKFKKCSAANSRLIEWLQEAAKNNPTK